MTSFQRNIKRIKKINRYYTHANPWVQSNTPHVARILKLTPPGI